MPSYNTYHLTWVSLTLGVGYLFPWVWGISHGCSSKAQLLLLSLDEGYVLPTSLPDLQRGIAPLGPPAPAQLLLLGHGLIFLAAAPGLGHGVAPPGRGPWPRSRGGSSQPLILASDPGWLLPAAAPDLGHGVAPLGHSCTVTAWHSWPLPLTSDMW